MAEIEAIAARRRSSLLGQELHVDEGNADERPLAQSRRRGSLTEQQAEQVNGQCSVFVRIRPILEQEQGQSSAVEILTGTKLRLHRPESGIMDLGFDRVFSPEATQADVYDVLRASVEAVTTGRNCTVLAYGQTGSGKTHTMSGAMEPTKNGAISALQGKDRGAIVRCLEDIFKWLESQRDQLVQQDCMLQMYVSYMEIYNEKVQDLLTAAKKRRGSVEGANFRGPSTGPADNGLEIRETKGVGVTVPGLTVVAVNEMEQAAEVLRIGNANRTFGHNGVNTTSSRSHAIFQVTLEWRYDNGLGAPSTTASKLNLVDLAGSEKLQPGGADLGRTSLLEELKSINLSLSALGQCIAALIDAKRSHVPYRDSKLTRLLQDALSGDSKAVMIICIGPSQSSIEETFSSLKFADRAKRAIIERRPSVGGSGMGVGAGPGGAQVNMLWAKVQELSEELQNERTARMKLEGMITKEGKNLGMSLGSKSPSGGSLMESSNGGVVQSRVEALSRQNEVLLARLERLEAGAGASSVGSMTPTSIGVHRGPPLSSISQLLEVHANNGPGSGSATPTERIRRLPQSPQSEAQTVYSAMEGTQEVPDIRSALQQLRSAAENSSVRPAELRHLVEETLGGDLGEVENGSRGSYASSARASSSTATSRQRRGSTGSEILDSRGSENAKERSNSAERNSTRRSMQSTTPSLWESPLWSPPHQRDQQRSDTRGGYPQERSQARESPFRLSELVRNQHEEANDGWNIWGSAAAAEEVRKQLEESPLLSGAAGGGQGRVSTRASGKWWDQDLPWDPNNGGKARDSRGIRDSNSNGSLSAASDGGKGAALIAPGKGPAQTRRRSSVKDIAARCWQQFDQETGNQ